MLHALTGVRMPKEFLEFIHNHEGWLTERIFSCALQQGYAQNTSTLKEPWRLSISCLTSSHPKTALLTDIFVMLKILSSEYRLYACGKIFRTP
jgi:hypothetical protein